MLEAARSLLFVPASDERKLRKALAARADAVVADLDDGVAPGAKDEARALVAGLTVPDTSENAAANLGWKDETGWGA